MAVGNQVVEICVPTFRAQMIGERNVKQEVLRNTRTNRFRLHKNNVALSNHDNIKLQTAILLGPAREAERLCAKRTLHNDVPKVQAGDIESAAATILVVVQITPDRQGARICGLRLSEYE